MREVDGVAVVLELDCERERVVGVRVLAGDGGLVVAGRGAPVAAAPALLPLLPRILSVSVRAAGGSRGGRAGRGGGAVPAAPLLGGAERWRVALLGGAREARRKGSHAAAGVRRERARSICRGNSGSVRSGLWLSNWWWG